jgi:hypothetical protein
MSTLDGSAPHDAAHPAAHHAPRDPARHASRRGRVSVTTLIVGASAAPILWLAQMLLSYGISADVCVGFTWATAVFTRTALHDTLFAFDAIAACGAIGGGLLSYRSWRLAGTTGGGGPPATADPEDATRFLAHWGMLSSLWFFAAIVFNTIASIMISPCLR